MDENTSNGAAPIIHEGGSVRGTPDENGAAKVYKSGDEHSLLNDEGFNDADFHYLETQGVISNFTGIKKAEPEKDPTVLAGRAARKYSQRDREQGPNEAKEFVGSQEPSREA